MKSYSPKVDHWIYELGCIDNMGKKEIIEFALALLDQSGVKRSTMLEIVESLELWEHISLKE